jgi:hypothetical protein
MTKPIALFGFERDAYNFAEHVSTEQKTCMPVQP